MLAKLLRNKKGEVIVKIFTFAIFAVFVGAIYFWYNYHLVMVIEDFVTIKRQEGSFKNFYFDSSKWDTRYFWENIDLIRMIVKSDKIAKVDGAEFFKYIMTIDAEDYEVFEENVQLFREANRSYVKSVFFDKGKANKKAIGRLYLWLFGVEPSIPDNFGEEGGNDEDDEEEEEEEE